MKKAWQKENADLGRPSWEALDLGEDKITKTQLALVLSLVVRSAFTRRSHGAGWSHKSPKFKSASSRSNRIVEFFPHQKKNTWRNPKPKDFEAVFAGGPPEVSVTGAGGARASQELQNYQNRREKERDRKKCRIVEREREIEAVGEKERQETRVDFCERVVVLPWGWGGLGGMGTKW